MEGRTDKWKDGGLEIPPCVLQDIGRKSSVHPKVTNTAKLRLFKKQIRDAKTDI